MTTYRISGVWKDSNNAITHYAIHKVNATSTDRAVKTTKAEAIRLLEITGNNATTWLWNYKSSDWNIGEIVEVVRGDSGKYLRTIPNDTSRDNLAHLIDYDWLQIT
jgi:hypothetical protein